VITSALVSSKFSVYAIDCM